MKLTSTPRLFEIAGVPLRIGRTTGGVVEIHGQNQIDLIRGLGFVHAHDRMAQMMLVRLVGQGRLCECLDDSDESLAIDRFMRQLGFAHLAREEAERCSPEAEAYASAYADGVNEYLRRHSRPWGLRLTGYRPELWQPADSLLTILLMSYVGLAQTQQDLEKFLIQAVQAGVDRSKLRELFSPHLDGLTDELAELIRQAQVVDRIIPHWPPIVPVLKSSNNWAVAPGRSASGRALECHDPHLECNRLPAVWYEVVLQMPDDYQIGITVPGVPGLIMGRTKNVSVGFTYGYMDMVDYFIEECRDGTYRRDNSWRPFRVRSETIQRKKHSAVDISVYENEHGTLEIDAKHTSPPNGFFLCRAFSAAKGGSAQSLHALAVWPAATTVAEAQRVLRDVSISCNWVLADRAGNIGYQQSGLLPQRGHSGLYPVPGWDDTTAWRGIVPGTDLASLLNPSEGFVVSANDNWNQPGKSPSINACQGPYRAERIRELLETKEKLTLADMRSFQADLYATQARRYMALLRPLLPATDAAREWLGWDLRYDVASTGATRFEQFYSELLRGVFGAGLFGVETWETLVASTNLFGAYFSNFDRILLDCGAANERRWFGERGREGVFRGILVRILQTDSVEVASWGAQRQVTMQNLLLGAKVPGALARWLGINFGPIALPGNRSTIVQGAIFTNHGRRSTFAPSHRAVTDMGTDEVHTALAGGPSERIFSPLYTTDVGRWINFEYKTLRAKSPESPASP